MYIFPCMLDNGSWGVEHVGASDDNCSFVGNYMGFYEAEHVAKEYAKRTGAKYAGDEPDFG